tara:strand:+ start:19808 stop:23860 length:4053 start_codon:yes stop_codon:yes gene_type:complete
MVTTSNNKKEFKSLGASNNDSEVPNLVQVLQNSFDWFTSEGIKELLNEVSPVEDFSGGRFELKFISHEVKKPDPETMLEDERNCRKQEITFSYPLYITVQLIVRETGEVKEQTLFFGDLPMMTSTGTFIINGAERVVISQLVRSPGGYFTTETDQNTGRNLCIGKVIPNRGAWIELETSPRNILYVKIDRKRKAPVTMLLRSLDWTDDSRVKSSEITDDEIIKLFTDVDNDKNFNFIKSTLIKDNTSEIYRNERNDKDILQRKHEAQLEIYRRQRPGEPPSIENASKLLENLFFDERVYDLGRVGRHRLNKVLRVTNDTPLLSNQDFVELIRRMIMINNGQSKVDDIDHLGNRRVRAVGELIQNQIRSGFLRMERVIKERMSTQLDPMVTTPAALINIRPIVAAIREFFGGSQLSQFMDQTNPLSELTHKRRLSALGPGGLSRERAGFDVRDVHHSHYGRICPIETPEGPNIGLLGSLSTYARINEFGFIETPYRKVLNSIKSNNPDILGRIPIEDIKNSNNVTIAQKNKPINSNNITEVLKLPSVDISVVPYISQDLESLEHLSADEEEKYQIGQATTNIDSKGQITSDTVEVRVGGESYLHVQPNEVDYMDVSPMQIVSVSTALIPFLEHDDANRALMGSNMQRQAVPLIKPQAPLIGTGMEKRVAEDSGQILSAKATGIVSDLNGDEIVITDNEGKDHIHPVNKFVRSNQTTCINQRPVVDKGILVNKGQAIADSSSTDQGELALGQNLKVGFMSFDGYNYEDAIILNQDLVKDDRYTSIHIEKHDLEARDTKLGPEEITRDIPNVGEESLSDLDDMGIVRVGAWVTAGDILVGKVTPKGETELSAEEKLLRAIFGEKARDVKDSSLRVPHGDQGKVIETRILTKENGDDLPPGVMKMVRVWIAHTRKIAQGDKMAGRHGNKGVVAKILPREDMPFTEDGTPLDIILNPIGVPSRMNLGQLLETHLGGAAEILGFHYRTSVFNNPKDGSIEDQMARAWIVQQSDSMDKKNLDSEEINWDKVEKWLNERGFQMSKLWSDAQTNRGVARDACLEIWLKEFVGIDSNKLKPSELMQTALKIAREKHISAPIFGKQSVYDGRTGEKFDQPVTVGNVYMLKLIHLVEDKIHARSTGPYSLITQQPLGGKAQFGGQRFGEMEVWALEAYSAAHTLQEILTIKSDDTLGRVKTYESIVKGEPIIQPGIPESFHVLMKEIQGLGLSMELMSEEISGDIMEEKDEALVNVGLDWDEVSTQEDIGVLDLEELDASLEDDEEGDEQLINDDDDIDDEEYDDDDDDDDDDGDDGDEEEEEYDDEDIFLEQENISSAENYEVSLEDLSEKELSDTDAEEE